MGYVISCKDLKQFRERMEFLFSKGFVFTRNRIKSWSEIEQDCSEYCYSWRCIYILHREQITDDDGHMTCKMTMNTSVMPDLNWSGLSVTKIRWDVFKREVLPTV